MRRAIAELVGTFCLVFAGTGAIVVNQTSGGAVTHVGVSLTFGLIVMTMIYALGDVSGAHLNPAVTAGFWLARRMSGRDAIVYAVVQAVGAIAASALMRAMFPDSDTLGLTSPVGSVWRSFVLEIFLTFVLMLVILSVSQGSREKGIMAGIAIGGVVALEAMFAGPVCGASMNPARSLAPALMSKHFASLWVYLTAPVIGAAGAVPLWSLLKGNPLERRAHLPNV